MIISMWLAYIVARKGIGAPFPSAGAPGIPAVKVGTVSLMEQWRRKVEDRTSRFFRWMLAGAVAQRAESASAPPACLAHNVALTEQPLTRSLSHSFLEDRTTIRLLRRSQTQVCCVLRMPGDEAAQEGLEQMQNCMSQLVVQAELDTEMDTDAQVPLSRED